MTSEPFLAQVMAHLASQPPGQTHPEHEIEYVCLTFRVTSHEKF